MNKTININVGGLPFIIDDEAYFKLESYLTSLEKHFKHSEGHDEIISDIESRISEIFNQRLDGRDIVESEDVMYAIDVMGTPDEMEEPYADYNQSSNRSNQNEKWQMNTGKRLFRDGDDKVLGGVCSGLAAYFGIADPVWVRIGFAIIGFTMGFGILPYIIMWAIIPEAKTSGDRLAMNGEQINVNNIAKTIEEGFGTLSDSLQEFGEGIRNKKKSSRTYESSKGKRKSFPLREVLKGTFTFVTIAIIIALFLTWISLIVGSLAVGHASSFILPWSGILSYALALPIIIIATVPIVGLIRKFGRTMNPSAFSPEKRFRWVGAGFTFIGFVLFFTIISLSARHLKTLESVKSEVLTFSADNEPVKIDLVSARTNRPLINNDLFELGKNHVTVKHSEKFSLGKSPDHQWHVYSIVEARGLSNMEAEQAAEKIELVHSFKNNVLSLGNGYTINRGEKFRGQNLRYEIQVPEGAVVDFDKTSLFKIECEAFPDHELHKELIGKSFKMGMDKLEDVNSSEGLLGEM